MPHLTNHTREILEKKGISKRDFKTALLNAGLSENVHFRLLSGEISFKTETLAIVASILGVTSLDEIIGYVPDDEDKQEATAA